MTNEWTPKEEAQIKKAFSLQTNEQNVKDVLNNLAKLMPSRTKATISTRWYSHIRPNLVLSTKEKTVTKKTKIIQLEKSVFDTLIASLSEEKKTELLINLLTQ